MSIISVHDLSKSFTTYNRRSGITGSFKDLISRQYTDFIAVDKLNINIEAGELVGYIGPNGAGKSTSIKMLTGILKPSSGNIRILDYEPFKDRKHYSQKIGVVFGQRTQLWWDIPTIESFNLLSKIYSVPSNIFKRKLEQLVEVMDLSEVLNTPVRKLSLGQRMRCDLAASLIHDPKILFLDEPTIGLDAVAKDSIRNFLRFINQEYKTTILLTTHDLKEIEELCQRIIVIDKGHKVYDGSLDNIKNIAGLQKTLKLEFNHEAPLEKINESFQSKLLFSREGSKTITTKYDSKEFATSEILKSIFANFDVSDVSIVEPNIEEVIMKIYKSGLN